MAAPRCDLLFLPLLDVMGISAGIGGYGEVVIHPKGTRTAPDGLSS